MKKFKIIISVLVVIILMVVTFFVIDYILRIKKLSSYEKLPNNGQNNSGVTTFIPTQDLSKIELKNDIIAYQEALKNRTINKVTMIAKEETVTPIGATFILTDKNDASCGYVDEYKIERNILGLWVPVIPITFKITVDESYWTLNKETVEKKKDWSKIYGALTKGRYRYVQKVHINNEYKYVYAEFNI